MSDACATQELNHIACAPSRSSTNNHASRTPYLLSDPFSDFMLTWQTVPSALHHAVLQELDVPLVHVQLDRHQVSLRIRFCTAGDQLARLTGTWVCEWHDNG